MKFLNNSSTRAGGVEKRSFRSHLSQELLIATRFGLVGLTATVAHILIVWLLLSETPVQPLVGNLCAFLIAFGISFSGNYIWTFRFQGQLGQAMIRFLLVSICAFGLNTLVLAGILSVNLISSSVAAIISAMVVPAFTFVASRLWCFRE